MRKPSWIRSNLPKGGKAESTRKILRGCGLHTVCEEARCPNLGECFSRGTATFMILGDICTRNCGFCAVTKGNPLPIDEEEPFRVAEAVKKFRLKYVVITSVTRDDLEDGGASVFESTIREVKKIESVKGIEVLIPDFKGSEEALAKVVNALPTVINHNLETIKRLYPRVRPMANYERSLNLLRKVKDLNPSIITKSGIMVGLGENKEEVIEVMEDLREANCDIITIGQYLQPTKENLPVERFITPEEFKEYEEIAYSLGFKLAFCAPLVRSSYKAEEVLNLLKEKGDTSNEALP
ncbi:MAG: lipoyl synthase [Synergistetes bacterium]|nr:MAG: Lipoyl synthase [bacterium 42_11]MBC7331243.1 lipoyl synthase [Synergistota bacterium]MDK2871543.1 lipoyl synthase [bacterium]